MSNKTKIDSVKPIRKNVMVVDMNFEATKSAGGIIINSDNGKTEGIKARWARVYAIGPEQQDVAVGEWILIDHGRWTRGFNFEDAAGKEIVARFVDVKDIIMASDRPHEEWGNKVGIDNSPTYRPEDFM